MKMSANRLIDMYAVQVFIAVAEEGSMSGAAARMGISQSGVSQMVRQLEDELGVVLVDRTTRPMALTAFGVALRNRGSVLSEELSHLKAQVIDAGRGVNPDLRIGLVDSFAATCGSVFTRQLLGKVTKNCEALMTANNSMSQAKIVRRPNLSAIGPANRLPRNRPAKEAAPSKPIHSAVSCSGPAAMLTAIPIMPSTKPSLNWPPVPLNTVRIWKRLSGRSSNAT